MSLPSALQAFATQPLLNAARGLFKDTLNIPLSPLADSPITPQRFFRDAYRADRHDSIDKVSMIRVCRLQDVPVVFQHDWQAWVH